ncbi:SGNH hydrolase-type esterase domain-containing protein [Dipodascopsis uninucleata]
MEREEYRKIYLIGDSQFELSWNSDGEFCFPAALSFCFGRRADVLNRGLSGYSSKWLKPQISRTVDEIERIGSDRVSAFLLWLGTNDSCLDGTPHHIAVSELEETARNFIFELHNSAPRARFILITPAPISKALLAKSATRTKGMDRTQAETKKYADAIVNLQLPESLGSECHVDKIDLFSEIIRLSDVSEQEMELDETEKIAKFTLDGLHLNGKGYKVLFDMVREVIDQWPDKKPSDMPGVEPGWIEAAKRYY